MLSFFTAFLWLTVLLIRIFTKNFEILPMILVGHYILLIIYAIRDGLSDT